MSVVRPAFIRPCAPAHAARPPQGDGWLHEPKLDGFRLQVVKNGREVRLFSRSGAEYTDRLSAMVEAFAELPARAAVLDGELVFAGADGRPRFYQLMAQMRARAPDEAALMFYAFDLLHGDGVDLRHLSLSARKRDLARLCRNVRIPCMRQVEAFPDGAVLFKHCAELSLEGIVSKRIDKPYAAAQAGIGLKQNV